jgi:hypothetical protein
MTFGSRLQVRRVQKTVDVKEKTLTSGQYVETTVTGLDSLTPTHEQRSAIEEHVEAGALVNIVDVFFFERLIATGILPAIREKHVLVDSSSVRYEVIEISDEGGQGNRLKVTSRRARQST